jgi:hypothetical protein
MLLSIITFNDFTDLDLSEPHTTKAALGNLSDSCAQTSNLTGQSLHVRPAPKAYALDIRLSRQAKKKACSCA